MEKLFGIDISHWQGDMSIEQARNERGVRFAIIKAAGADDGKYKDSKFENYYAQCKAIGLPVGAYYNGNAKSVAEAEQKQIIFCPSLPESSLNILSTTT